MFWTPADGDGQAEPMTPDAPGVRFPNDWSPDGRVLAFAEVAGVAREPNWNVLAWSADGNPRPIVHGPFKEFAPTFSPDGRWLAYVSEQSGRREVYVRPYPGPGAAVQITFDGGDQPRWGRDGTELFFYHGEQFMRAQVKATPELSSSRPEGRSLPPQRPMLMATHLSLQLTLRQVSHKPPHLHRGEAFQHRRRQNRPRFV